MNKALYLLIWIFGSVSFLTAQPKANFSASPSKGCTPATIKFTNQSSGSGLSYFWDLGNGNTSTLGNPQAIYYNPGFYTVKLYIKDNLGRTDSMVRFNYVEIFKNPVACFDASKFKGCTPFDPGLIDKSVRGSGMINQWSWDYGDGTVTGRQSPSHAYLNGGVYDVSLIVKDVNGCQDQVTKNKFITVNTAATVAFSADKLSSCTSPFQVNFSDRSIGTGSGDGYYWEFGDGTTSGIKNPQKTYSTQGNFTVKLTITSANGCVSAAQLNNYITLSAIKPQFALSQPTACAGDSVTFTNQSAPKGLKFIAEWDFGDGNKSKGNQVKHAYRTTGLYPITLTVSLPDGSCKESTRFPDAIQIMGKPRANFFITDTLLCMPGLRDTLIDKSVGGITRSWFLNDSFIASTGWISVKILKKGYNKVRLVSGNGYCYDTLTRNRAILVDTAFANFTLYPEKGCKPLKVEFEDQSESGNPITSYFWDLGDGNYQNQSHFEHTYLYEGMYPVMLTLTNSLGCSFRFRDTVFVGSKPDLAFGKQKDSLCPMDLLTVLDAKNTNSVKVTDWKWYLDTSLISIGKVLNYKVKNQNGTFDLKLIGSHWGCSDTVTFEDGVTIMPPAMRYKVEYDSCKGYPFTFINTSEEADTITWIFEDNSVLGDVDTLVVRGPQDKWPVKLWGRNNRFQCEGEYTEPLIPFTTRVDFSFNGGTCSPAKLLFSNLSQNYTRFNWDFGKGIEEINHVNFYKSFNPGTFHVRLMAAHDNGCKDTLEKTLTINGPSAHVEVTPKSGCAPLEITLISRVNNSGIRNKLWQISGLQDIPVTKDTMKITLDKQGPLANGRYRIGLFLEDQNGCSSLTADTVSLKSHNYHFTLSSFPTCAYPIFYVQPLFAASDSHLVSQAMYWDMGDGRTFTGRNIAHQYQDEGNFKVSLKMIDSEGCITVRDTLINNSVKTLKADLTADKLDASCPPLTVRFQSRSVSHFGNIVKYHWDFGDGSTSNLVSPSHIYLKSGSFTVKLKVTNEVNCSDEIIYKDLILIDGPKGTFHFDKKTGCSPLRIQFSAAVQNTFTIEWDMGDGQILKDSSNLGYEYQRVGKYIPMLVLEDSFGCRYTLPPNDTIQVLPDPVAQFDFGTPCIRQPVYFTNTSNAVYGNIIKCHWDFGDGTTSSETDPKHVYQTKGTYMVRLTVWNSGNCVSTTGKYLKVRNLEANFSSVKPYYCSGQIPELVNTSQSDTLFSKWEWYLNGVFLSNQKTPTLTGLPSGEYELTLITADKNGCSDTLTVPDGIVVGDTLAPVSPYIYRVTVENDVQVQLDHSGPRGHDFKHFNLFQRNLNGEFVKVISLPGRFDTSQMISALNTLHQQYCFKLTATNLCGYESALTEALEHCTVETKAAGEIRKIRVKWNAYKGWPVQRYEVYREESGLKGNYLYLATVDGHTLEYMDTMVYCKMDHHYRIMAVESGGFKQISWSDTAAARPSTRHAVPPNFTIRATVDYDREITLEWTGSGTPRTPVKSYIIERSDDGKQYRWSKSFTPEVYSFTDKKVAVDQQSYFYRTYSIDTCDQQSEIVNFAKTILLRADTTPQERPFVTWSTYQGWSEGVVQYEVQRKKEDGTFVTIGNSSPTDTMMVDNVTDLNGYPEYCYRVIGYKTPASGQSQVISISNEDCAPVRSRIFAANAFTINEDGLNESFDVKGLYIKNYNIKIFNRWGEKVFESNDMNHDWNGCSRGEICQMGAYIWIIRAIGVDEVNWSLKGTVTLVR